MKLLITTGLYPPEIGGPATHTVLLEKELTKLGYTVKVLPFSTSRNKPKFVRHIDYFFKVLLRAFKSDVVFAQDVVSVGFPSLIASRLLGKVFVVRVPGDYAWEQSVQRYGVTEGIDAFQNTRYPFKVRLLKYIQGITTKYADAVVTPSNYFKTLVTGWGVAEDKIKTIYNGIDLDYLPNNRVKFTTPTIVTAGRLVQWKGFSKLLDLMVRLPNWKLIIIGSGPDKEKLEAKIKLLNLDSQVTLVGSIPRSEVLDYCAKATAFVLNTHFESFSYQIVEAMSVGAPIITTNVGSIPELITNGVDGCLVEPDDLDAVGKALTSSLEQKDVWETRTQSAMKKAQKFNIENTVSEFNILFTKVIKK